MKEFEFKKNVQNIKIIQLDDDNFEFKKVANQFENVDCLTFFVSLSDYNKMLSEEDLSLSFHTFLVILKIFQKEKKIFIPRRLSLYLLSFLQDSHYHPSRNKLIHSITHQFGQLANSRYFCETKKVIVFDISGFEKMIQKNPFGDFIPQYNDKEAIEEIIQFLKRLASDQLYDHRDQLYSHIIESSSFKNVEVVFIAIYEMIIMRYLLCD